MAESDQTRDNFSERLEQMRLAHEKLLNEDIAKLSKSFSGERISASELSASFSKTEFVLHKSVPIPPPLPQARNALVNMTNSSPLKALDELFFSSFNLGKHLAFSKLSYPTIFCESLEEFFIPFMADLNFSTQTKKQELQRLIAEAQKMAEVKQGGIFGVNFPGRGCYLNGWLFAKLAKIDPSAVPDHPEVFSKVLATAAHEKLGHGFLSVYSTLGQLKTELGISLTQIASQFGMYPSDDPILQLRNQQNSILFDVSQFLEEGWATFIEDYVKMNFLQTSQSPEHSLQAIIDSSSSLPKELCDSFLLAVQRIFLTESVSTSDILDAINFLAQVGEKFDDVFTSSLHQPLRYALGELLCLQCASNCGVECVPYGVLIAANISFDPTKISLTDLSLLLKKDPRLNPDVRLAAISKLKLDNKGNVQELAERVSAELSFSIPSEVKS